MAEEFQRRLDSILGALDQHDPQSSAPSWSISDRIVQNRGQDPSDSESEDEREHQECIQVSWSTQRCQFRIVLELCYKFMFWRDLCLCAYSTLNQAIPRALDAATLLWHAIVASTS